MSLFFGELFYYVLEATQYNTQTLSVVESWNLTKGVKTLPIGHAFNPTIALINHSCDPNAVRYNCFPMFSWRLLLLLALRAKWLK